MPTETSTRTMRRILHEAMDAGAHGWSAQRLQARRSLRGSARLRRLADEHRHHARRDLPGDGPSARRARRRLHGTDPGQQRPEADAEHYEQIAEVSGRPIMFETVTSQIASRIAIATRSNGWRAAASADCRFTARALPPTPAQLHLRGLEPVRRLRRLARGDHRHRRGTQEKLGDPRRREALRARCRAKA